MFSEPAEAGHKLILNELCMGRRGGGSKKYQNCVASERRENGKRESQGDGNRGRKRKTTVRNIL